jgi:hypothetical protein
LIVSFFASLADVLKLESVLRGAPEHLLDTYEEERQPVDPSRVLKKGVYPALEKLKMPRVGWRAFRHTVATHPAPHR